MDDKAPQAQKQLPAQLPATYDTQTGIVTITLALPSGDAPTIVVFPPADVKELVQQLWAEDRQVRRELFMAMMHESLQELGYRRFGTQWVKQE